MLSEVQEHQRAAGCGREEQDKSSAPLHRLAADALACIVRQPLNPFAPVKLVAYEPPKRK
jgi:hypothetical protein